MDIGIPKVEIFRSFLGVIHGDVLSCATLTIASQGLLVATLDDLVAWKRAHGRPKDLADLITIGVDPYWTHHYLPRIKT